MINKLFGSFFLELTGKNVNQFKDIESISSAIESKNKKKIHASKFDSNIVHSRGNIFQFSRFDDLNSKIGRYLD